ncbi:MAG: aminoglycoside phosphotransferase family protein [Chloroflexota bacterium]|nr:aminoglycoside phosphotransferase family protein [Chloroflexota bacterium]
MTQNELEAAVRGLLPAGASGPVEIGAIPGGANNRVFRVSRGRRTYLLKWYFCQPGDPRDRLAAEFSFSSFAWQSGVRCIPRPVACDAARQLALYGFVEGRPILPGEVGLAEVQEAADFVVALNRSRGGAEATSLANGAEACFSLAEHLGCLERRIQRLMTVEPSSSLHLDVLDFVADALAPEARALKTQIIGQVGRAAFERVLASSERCLSPSDFGFHNALRRPNGELCFLDFEYAGWDDPARMVADFFCQVAVPAPGHHMDVMIRAAASATSHRANLEARVLLLLPVYRLKWTCILLNEFLPEGRRRREFADELAGQVARKEVQLSKARVMFGCRREVAVA